MGRPPSNGGPTFRFNSTEVAEMEAILQGHNNAMPVRELLEAVAEKFSVSAERSGKIEVQMKQVWHWFQNRRYALRAKAAKGPGKLGVSLMPRVDSATVKSVLLAPRLLPVPSDTVRNVPQAPQNLPASSGKNVSDNSQMEFEAKSARDGAWYDVATFLSHRHLETGDPEVLVRFAGFGPEEDEWVNIRRLVRLRSLPCESLECVVILPGDLILCFQEGNEQALYFDAHVLDAQRRRHDVRGCRCRFLVRYDHDQSEEIVPLRKVCRRPETDYRLQQLHAVNESATVNQHKTGADPHTGSLRVYPPAEAKQKLHKAEERADAAVVAPVAAPTNVPQVTETEIQQPEVAEIDSASDMGNSDVPPNNVAVMSRTTTNTNITGGSGQNMPRVTGTDVQQPKVSEIVSATDVESSNVPPGNVDVMSETATTITGGSGQNMPRVTETEVQQPKVAEIVSASSLETSNLPPGNVDVMSGTATTGQSC